MDPNLGPVFYILGQPGAAAPGAPQQPPAAAAAPKLEHELTRCLSCHDSYSLSGDGVPRFIVGSGYTGTGGQLVSHEGWILVTDQTPLKSRWGGWYVTGMHGKQVHLGNMLIRATADFQRLEELRVGNIENVDALFRREAVRDEQERHRRAARARASGERAERHHARELRRAHGRSTASAAPRKRRKGYGQPLATLSPALHKVVADSVEPLVQTLLFADEAKLTDAVSGEPRFVEQLSRSAQFATRRGARCATST
jgi:hypothetical protein